MTKSSVNKHTRHLLAYIFVLILILLSFVNISHIFLPEIKVLGAETSENTDLQFWQNFLEKNPKYIPGWIEIKNTEAAKQINPNFTNSNY